MEAIRKDRAEQRRRLLCAARERLLASARELGVDILFFGSSVQGVTDAESDLDVMLLGNPDDCKRRAAIQKFERIAAKTGVPIDIILQSDAPELYREIQDAHRLI